MTYYVDAHLHDLKQCDRCGETKETSQFPTRGRDKADKWRICSACRYALRNEYRGLVAPPRDEQQAASRKAAKTRALNKSSTAAERNAIQWRWKRERGTDPREASLEKPCPGCGERKAARAFGRDRSRKDGLTVRCRSCRSKSAR